MSKKNDWMSLPVVTGSIVVAVLPLLSVLLTAERNFPGCSSEKLAKNTIARSEAWGFGVPGLSLMNCATTAGCALDQSSTYAPWVGSAVTQPCAIELCALAHCSTMCGLPWETSFWNQLSMSGATGCPAFAPP